MTPDTSNKKKTKQTAKYSNIHSWLKNTFGKAYNCENINCESTNSKRYEWALVKGKVYDRVRENFIQLCPSCHRKYDFTEKIRENMSKGKKGKPFLNNPMKRVEIRAMASKWMKKRVTSEATRKKMSDSRKGKPPIYILEGRQIKKFGSDNSASRKVIDEKSGIVYDTVTLAAAALNLKRTTLTAMLNGQNKNKTSFKFYE